MDTSTTELVKHAVGSLVRWLLVLAGGILVKKGIISTEQSEVYIQQFTPVLIGVLMAGLALVWSLWQKSRANKKLDIALQMPAGATRAALEKQVDYVA